MQYNKPLNPVRSSGNVKGTATTAKAGYLCRKGGSPPAEANGDTLKWVSMSGGRERTVRQTLNVDIIKKEGKVKLVTVFMWLVSWRLRVLRTKVYGMACLEQGGSGIKVHVRIRSIFDKLINLSD
jgi:hypothetical protein